MHTKTMRYLLLALLTACNLATPEPTQNTSRQALAPEAPEVPEDAPDAPAAQVCVYIHGPDEPREPWVDINSDIEFITTDEPRESVAARLADGGYTVELDMDDPGEDDGIGERARRPQPGADFLVLSESILCTIGEDPTVYHCADVMKTTVIPATNELLQNLTCLVE